VVKDLLVLKDLKVVHHKGPKDHKEVLQKELRET
jgi:hypothetical protein